MIIIAISYPLSKNISQQYKINDEIKDLQKEINNLESDNDDLSKLIKFLESDQFADRQARLNLNLKKEGEEVVVIKNMDETPNSSGSNPDNNGNISATGNLKNAQKKNQWFGNLYKWLNYFDN